MQPNTKACVAYIAGCSTSGKNSSSIYDYDQGKYIISVVQFLRCKPIFMIMIEAAMYRGNWVIFMIMVSVHTFS